MPNLPQMRWTYHEKEVFVAVTRRCIEQLREAAGDKRHMEVEKSCA